MFDFEFSFAFQPIVDVAARRVISFEALVRGPRGEPSSEVFCRVPTGALHSFDQACRLRAIQLASRLSLNGSLHLNFLPDPVGESREFLFATLKASQEAGIAPQRLVFEVTEAGYCQGSGRVEQIFAGLAGFGFHTAIDDFGSGLSGLRRLVEHQPNYVKLDRDLVADIDGHRARQAIVKAICDMCRRLSITPIAEGVETTGEYRWLRAAGIHVFQGYYFGRPAFEALPQVESWPFKT